MTKLYIARHGNTFDPGDTLLRVGARTDLPLSASGRAQAKALGHFFQDAGLRFSKVYTSKLKRTYETAQIALQTSDMRPPIIQEDIFNEVDFGVDEGKPEVDVVARLGKQAIQDWDNKSIVPEGWRVNPQAIVRNWQVFLHQLVHDHPHETVLVATSNGIARFVLSLCADFESFQAKQKPKLATGALGCLQFDGKHWGITFWNERPQAPLDTPCDNVS